MENSDNIIKMSDQKRSLLIAIFFLLLALPFANSFDNFWRGFIGFPSAKICSVFLSSDCMATDDGYLIANKALPVHITNACNASSFFILTLVIVSTAVIQSFKPHELIKFYWAFPLAYIITILANSARIIAGWLTGKWARMILPHNYWPSIHLATGVFVFLTFLIATYVILKWRPPNGYQNSNLPNS